MSGNTDQEMRERALEDKRKLIYSRRKDLSAQMEHLNRDIRKIKLKLLIYHCNLNPPLNGEPEIDEDEVNLETPELRRKLVRLQEQHRRLSVTYRKITIEWEELVSHREFWNWV